MNRLNCGFLCGFLLLLPALPAHAQEDRPLTEERAAAIAALYNQPGSIRLTGESRIPAGSEMAGDVASLGGPLVVDGTVRGNVVIINGDLRLTDGGRITGRAVVAGGRFEGDVGAVEGGLEVYPETFRFRREGNDLIGLGPDPGQGLSTGALTPFGRIDLNATVDGSYNRVEGLPIAFGPRLETQATNPTILDARLIYRTRSGLRVHPEEFGHDVRLEQYVGGRRSVRLGLGLHRTVDPIETRGVSDTENSLATFIMHRDYRDHYSRRGWVGYVAYTGRTRPLDAGLEYRDEAHGAVPTHSPWSLLYNDDPWRAQPQVAEGDLRTLRGWFRWDTRNDRTDPATGWLVQVESEQGLEGDLRLLSHGGFTPGGEPLTESRSVGAEFTTARVDLRRYLRLGPRTRVAFRAAAAGSPDDGALPPQRQQALGGEGSLPGYDRFGLDCGARQQIQVDSLLPYYGCDRSVLIQAEARFSLLAGGFSPGRWLGLDFDLLTTPELVLFADAGSAWIEEESLQGRGAGSRALRYDAGVGLKLGRIGFYLAAPLSDGGDGPNFFIRLGPRL